MSSTRLYLDAIIEPGSDLELTGDRARYVGRVLRLRKGDRLNLFDGRGGEYGADIIRTGKSSVVVQVIEAIETDVESPLDIHLLQGVSRGERMDVVVQKATELGIHRITPVQTEYTVVRLSGTRAEKRLAHWRGVAASACEQCGRNQLPGIDPITGLRDWLGQNFGDERRRIVLAPGAERTIGSLEPPDGRLTVLIGPEGGLSADELELATGAGFEAIGFGPRILRTETAAVAVLSALQVAFGDCG